MSEWTTADLAAVDRDGELRVAVRRPDGTLRAPTIVWHVVVDGHLFVRSVRGEDGAWYRAVRRTPTGTIEAGGLRADVSFVRDDTHDEAIDRAYHDKYGDGSSVRSITSATASTTTLRVDRR